MTDVPDSTSSAGGTSNTGGLRDLSLPSFLETSASDLIADLFVPALERSVRYDRGVGYFSSCWLKLAAQGLVNFAARGGRARWVTSPILSSEDWAALHEGDEARRNVILRDTLEQAINSDLASALEANTRQALAWMVADGVLTFRLALPRGRLDQGDFHDKFGVFTDAAGDKVAFNGSYNDSIQGTRNYESIKVFFSWESETWSRFGRPDEERFGRLWNNLDPNVQVYDLPEALRARILQLREGAKRPYPAPPGAEDLQEVITENQEISLAVSAVPKARSPKVPAELSLRSYQIQAIDAWFANGYRGLFEMATGTGKTITALAASARLFEQEGQRLAIIIVAPYVHLVDQWIREAAAFGWRCIPAYGSKASYTNRLRERIAAFRLKDVDTLAIATTYTTFASESFQEIVSQIGSPVLLIADEAHHVGAEGRRTSLPETIPFRLALSATPARWFDEAGTRALQNYFDKTVFRLSLEEAIGKSLTPYYYYPVLVELTSEEMVTYRALSAKIAKAMFAASGQRATSANEEHLARLLIERARIVNNAENKIATLSELIDTHCAKQIGGASGSPSGTLSQALFYCAPGEGQLEAVNQMLAFEKGLAVHTFTAEEDMPTRRKLLDSFAKGELAALVAMKCLDEGVDVPSTRVAFLLASSSNPREFIQRRGRVLRRAPGKEFAVLYDLIAAPPSPQTLPDEQSLAAERSLLRRELRRFAEFAQSSLNAFSAYDVVWQLARSYGVMDFLTEENMGDIPIRNSPVYSAMDNPTN